MKVRLPARDEAQFEKNVAKIQAAVKCGGIAVCVEQAYLKRDAKMLERAMGMLTVAISEQEAVTGESIREHFWSEFFKAENEPTPEQRAFGKIMKKAMKAPAPKKGRK